MEYDVDSTTESDNINSLWLKSVFESLKSLENMERMAREGCSSLLEYLQYPIELRASQFADIQYKNLRFMVTEFSLLIRKLNPIIDETYGNTLMLTVSRLQNVIDRRGLFVKEVKKNNYISTELTNNFSRALFLLSEAISEIIKKIDYILYIKEKDNKPKW